MSTNLRLVPGPPPQREENDQELELGTQSLAAAKIHDGISERRLSLEFSETGALVVTVHDASPRTYHLPIENLFLEALRRSDEDLEGLN